MASNTENIEKLIDSESFEFWKFQTSVTFKSQGINDIVNGELKLEALDSDVKKQDEYKKKEAVAQKENVTSVGKRCLVHILTDKTSHAMYSKLCSIFEIDSEQEKCSLLQEFFNYK